MGHFKYSDMQACTLLCMSQCRLHATRGSRLHIEVKMNPYGMRNFTCKTDITVYKNYSWCVVIVTILWTRSKSVCGKYITDNNHVSWCLLGIKLSVLLLSSATNSLKNLTIFLVKRLSRQGCWGVKWTCGINLV